MLLPAHIEDHLAGLLPPGEDLLLVGGEGEGRGEGVFVLRVFLTEGLTLYTPVTSNIGKVFNKMFFVSVVFTLQSFHHTVQVEENQPNCELDDKELKFL